MKFIEKNLMPSDILAGRNENPKAATAKAIRAILGSWTNHNALFVLGPHGIEIGDTVPPRALVVPLSHYEDLINRGLYKVRVWRVRAMTHDERLAVSAEWYLFSNHQPYPEKSIYLLSLFRFVNSLPFEIQGEWCTKNTLKPFGKILPPERDPRTRPDGVFKHNPTPRTMANRLEAGILEDVTEHVTE